MHHMSLSKLPLIIMVYFKQTSINNVQNTYNYNTKTKLSTVLKSCQNDHSIGGHHCGIEKRIKLMGTYI